MHDAISEGIYQLHINFALIAYYYMYQELRGVRG